MEVGEHEDRSDRTVGGACSTGAVRRDRAGRVPADGGTGPSRARGDPLRQRRLRDGRATGVGDPRGVAARPRGCRPEHSPDARAGSGLRAGAPVRRHPQPRRLLRPSDGPPRQDAGRDHPARPARPPRSTDDLRAVQHGPAGLDQRQPTRAAPRRQLGRDGLQRNRPGELHLQREGRRLLRLRGPDLPREEHRGCDCHRSANRCAAPDCGEGRPGRRRLPRVRDQAAHRRQAGRVPRRAR